MTINYKTILLSKYRDFDWVMESESDYSSLIWNDVGVPKPTQDYLDELVVAEARKQTVMWEDYRVAEYPPTNVQLDVIWHMMDDETIPGKGSEWYNLIKDVKDKYPKPE